MRLVVRADASVGMGTGHVMRCLALAQEWQARGGSVWFVASIDSPVLGERLIREGITTAEATLPAGSAADASHTAATAREFGADAIVVDGYHFDAAYRHALRAEGFRLAIIDDNGDLGPYDADVLVNQNAHARSALYPDATPGTRLLLGTRYTLLRQEFQTIEPQKQSAPDVVDRVLISMGGSDPDNATLRVLEALAMLDAPSFRCDVLVGAANPHEDTLTAANFDFEIDIVRDPLDLAKRMARADLAISAGGTTLWELCYLGIPTIALSLADNQIGAVAHLHTAGALVDATPQWTASAEGFSRCVHQVMSDQALRDSLSTTAAALVDGRGAQRVIDLLQSLEED